MKKIILFALAGNTCFVNAQVGVTNAGNLQIHTGASLSGFGSLNNTSSATLVNNGNLYVKGNITNNQASMATGTGTLFLDGSVSQSVAGSQTLKTNHFNSNNNAGIVLNNHLSVSGIHTFTNGLISTSVTPHYLQYEAGSSYTGSSDSRHVTGWVKKIGTTDFSFPVGDASYLRPAGVVNLSAAAEFNCRYYTPTQNIANVATPIRMVKANEYWQIDKITGGTARVALNWDHSKVAMDNVLLTDIVAAYYTAGNWTSNGGSASGNVLTTGNINSTNTGSFGAFTFGYTTYPVPLTLISFTAERKQGFSFLRWVTENEQNVSHFEIQRSYDATNYSTIGNTAARNRGSLELYTFDDHTPLLGFAWYRIRSVDIDGRYSYTKIAVVSETGNSNHTFFVMNPARNAITIINKTGRAGVFHYNLYNETGQLLLSGEMNMMVGSGTALPLRSTHAAGIYILEIQDSKVHFRQKILVEKY